MATNRKITTSKSVGFQPWPLACSLAASDMTLPMLRQISVAGSTTSDFLTRFFCIFFVFCLITFWFSSRTLLWTCCWIKTMAGCRTGTSNQGARRQNYFDNLEAGRRQDQENMHRTPTNHWRTQEPKKQKHSRNTQTLLYTFSLSQFPRSIKHRARYRWQEVSKQHYRLSQTEQKKNPNLGHTFHLEMWDTKRQRSK